MTPDDSLLVAPAARRWCHGSSGKPCGRARISPAARRSTRPGPGYAFRCTSRDRDLNCAGADGASRPSVITRRTGGWSLDMVTGRRCLTRPRRGSACDVTCSSSLLRRWSSLPKARKAATRTRRRARRWGAALELRVGDRGGPRLAAAQRRVRSCARRGSRWPSSAGRVRRRCGQEQLAEQHDRERGRPGGRPRMVGAQEWRSKAYRVAPLIADAGSTLAFISRDGPMRFDRRTGALARPISPAPIRR